MDQATRVLVAHGDAAARNLVHLTFAGDGWHVVEAEDAPTAVRSVAAHRPGVVVLDADLPGSGWRPVVRALRGDPRTAGIPIVLLAAAGHDRPAPADDPHVDAVVEPPLDPFGLLDAVLHATDHARR